MSVEIISYAPACIQCLEHTYYYMFNNVIYYCLKRWRKELAKNREKMLGGSDKDKDRDKEEKKDKKEV